MQEDIQEAVSRVRQPGQGPWFVERCERLHRRKTEIATALLPLTFSARIQPDTVSPEAHLYIGPEQRSWRDLTLKYDAYIGLSALCDVFFIHYSVELASESPLYGVPPHYLMPELRCGQEPPIRAFREIVPVIESLGWRLVSVAEQHEHCPGLSFWPENSMGGALGPGTVRVRAAVTEDLNGWLDDVNAEPRPWQDVPPGLSPIDAAIRDVYGHPTVDTARRRAERRPPWVDVAAAQLRDVPNSNGVEALAPTPYPASGWTIDFGRITDGALDVHFYTDVFVSHLAPVWYCTERFVMDHPMPDALIPRIHDWFPGEAGYIGRQTNLALALCEALQNAGCTKLTEGQLLSSLPSPIRHLRPEAAPYMRVKEALFRDPLGIFDPAPKMEEEQLVRALGVRPSRLEVP